MKLRTSVN